MVPDKQAATCDAADAASSLETLAREVDELRAAQVRDRAVLEELMAELARHGLGDAPGATVHETWTDWVDQWLTPRISRSPHSHRWCRRYAEHPEVADRLEALWVAWERQWPDPLARLPWFRDGLDHHWPVITADDGPLRDCSAVEDVHVEQQPLPGAGVSRH